MRRRLGVEQEATAEAEEAAARRLRAAHQTLAERLTGRDAARRRRWELTDLEQQVRA